MRINKIKWKNFTSWGNSWTELSFNTPSGLNLISGRNGAGKSSIANLITYMLYGQLEGFTLKDIPNRVNKHFEGEIEIESENKHIRIRRGLAPSLFELYVNDEKIDIAGKSNVQTYLEEELLKIPYTIFKNIINLSVNKFKSFANLGAKEKREIVDRLFGYEILNKASTIAKEQTRGLKSEIEKSEAKRTEIESNISIIDDNINEVKKEENEEDISKLETNLQQLNTTYSALISKRDKLNEKKTALTQDLYNVRSRLDGLKAEENRIEKQINERKLFTESTTQLICPYCGSVIDRKHNEELIRDLNLQKDEIDGKIAEGGDKKSEIETTIDTINSHITPLNSKLNELSTEIRAREVELSSRKKAGEQKISNLETLKTSLLKKLEHEQQNSDNLNKKLLLMNAVQDVFSDSGLKEYIAGFYTPILNAYVEEMCYELEIPYKIKFDTNYNCEICNLGEEVNYDILSTGERKKLDIAITLAFLKILIQKVGDVNVLFLDEVLSSIDVSSCDELMKILSNFSKNNLINVFLIHHANLDSTYIDNIIEIEKQNSFSKLNYL